MPSDASFGAAISKPHRHHHRTLPGRRADRRNRAHARAISFDKLKQSFIVENISRRQYHRRLEKVAHARAGRLHAAVANLQMSANVTLYKSLPFDTEKDFVPVMLINRNPLVLVGRTTLAPNTLPQLIALMKKERLKAAMPGFGTTGHLVSALFAQEAGVTLDHIPYRGAAPAMTDLLGDHVDLFFGTPQSFVQQVTTGKLKAYGITSKDKLPEFRTPRASDTLGPKFEIMYWQGLFAPAGTPEPVIKTLNAAVQEAVSDPAIVKTWAAQASRFSARSAFASGGKGVDEERDRALGQDDPRQQYSRRTVRPGNAGAIASY